MSFVLGFSLLGLNGCAEDGAQTAVNSTSAGKGEQASAQQSLRSVDELPVDRFDEYQAGTFPPDPWIPLGPETDGVTTRLVTEAESPFVGNTTTGKGLVVDDRSTESGTGTGIGCGFYAPPKGRVFLGFEFRYDPAKDSAEGLDTICLLDDASATSSPAPGLELHLGQGGKLSLWANDNTLQPLADLAPGMWYHIGLIIDGGRVYVTVISADNMNADRYRVKIKDEQKVERTEGDFNAPAQYTRLSFFSNGEAQATGSWTIDNICMAGQVDASRREWLPFNQLPTSTLRASEHKVYAYYYIYTAGGSTEDPGLSWYTRTVLNPTLTKEDRKKAGSEMLCRPLPRLPLQDNDLDRRKQIEKGMEEEVRLAVQQGLDGFFADFHSHPVVEGGGAHFTENSFSLMNAAQTIDPDFKIIPAVYSRVKQSGVHGEGDEGCDPVEYANSPIIKRIAEHPATLRLPDGRFVLSQWLTERHSADWWKQVLAQLEKNGTPAVLLAQFNSYDVISTFKDLCYGMAQWGPREPKPYEWIPTARSLTEKVIFPICNQDVRTRGCALWEAEGSGLLRSLWTQAIDGGADWAFMNTWSDYTETPMEPSTFMGYVPYDLSAYYLQWFKTGTPPEIVRDRLYYFYRRNHSNVIARLGVTWKSRQSMLKDEIELLAFLREPGELSITIDGQEFKQQAPAGITSFKVPLPEGKQFTPSFALSRDGKVVSSRKGQYAILAPVEYPHMIYSSGVIPTNAELIEGGNNQ